MSEKYDAIVDYVNSQPAPNTHHTINIGGQNSAFEPLHKPVLKERKHAFRFLKFLFRGNSDEVSSSRR